MKIDIITLFPEMFSGPFDESIVKRAQDKGLVEINIHNLRRWTKDKHKSVDDRPYGGGTGMILMVEPIYLALEELRKKDTKVVLLSPQGKKYDQNMAEAMVNNKHIIFIAGHYEGFDERIRENLIDEELSIGDYILTGGELPAMVIVDSLVRLIPGVLEKKEAVELESFSKDSKLLEHPQYTRPSDFKGWKVPKVLLSGNHAKIEKWKEEQSLSNTIKKRPDLDHR